MTCSPSLFLSSCSVTRLAGMRRRERATDGFVFQMVVRGQIKILFCVSPFSVHGDHCCTIVIHVYTCLDRREAKVSIGVFVEPQILLSAGGALTRGVRGHAPQKCLNI